MAKGLGTKMLESVREAFRSATEVTLMPILAALFASAAMCLAVYVRPSLLMMAMPEAVVRNQNMNAQEWAAVHVANETGPKVIVLGGSQAWAAFQSLGESHGDKGEVPIYNCAFDRQSVFDSMCAVFNTKLDSDTYIFIHISPGRLRRAPESLGVASAWGMLDYSGTFDALRNVNVEIKDENRDRRLINRLSNIIKYPFSPPVKFLDPVPHVKRLALKNIRRGTSPYDFSDGTESVMNALRIMKEYVDGKGAHLYLIEYPFNWEFPYGTPGWDPQAHGDKKVREWLEGVAADPGRLTQINDFTPEYDARIHSLGIPVISFRDDSSFSSADFRDSVHLRAGGARRFLPIFRDVLEALSSKKS